MICVYVHSLHASHICFATSQKIIQRILTQRLFADKIMWHLYTHTHDKLLRVVYSFHLPSKIFQPLFIYAIDTAHVLKVFRKLKRSLMRQHEIYI